MKLQLALDFLSLAEALPILDAAWEYADILEVGTPLLLGEGLTAVRAIKDRCPGKKILADVKIMDAGALETRMAAAAGADIVTVLGAAPDETIAQAARAAREMGARLTVDMIGMEDAPRRCLRMRALGAHCVCLHTSYDTPELPPPAEALARIRGCVDGLEVAVTGGVTLDNIGALIDLSPDIIVVGRAVTTAQDPADKAKCFFKRLNANKPEIGCGG